MDTTQKETLVEKLEDALESNQKYHLASNIVLGNSFDNVWLVGGMVYRNLAYCLYGIRPPRVDFDFLVECPTSELFLPPGWRMRKNRHGNPKLKRRGLKIDFMLLENFTLGSGYKIRSFDEYLSSVPLTIQSIGYNIVTGELRGEVGIAAIETKTVAVNNVEEAKIKASRLFTSVNRLVKRKAKSLNFIPELDY